ncbi:hypothetical protein HUJ04_001508 [Dendroctonus ponderosae]|nr:hypothetical protein HUJ04_001508 [Dendroctonus ponderosae]
MQRRKNDDFAAFEKRVLRRRRGWTVVIGSELPKGVKINSDRGESLNAENKENVLDMAEVNSVQGVLAMNAA